MNKEGLTFEEWVLAAGVARFGYTHTEGVYPYTSSDTAYRVAHPGTPGTSDERFLDHCPAMKKVRYSRCFYPTKIRKAWREGEDPTEYRAAGCT